MEGKNKFCTFFWSVNWLFKERKDTSYHILSKKHKNLERKFIFDIPNIKFQNGLEQKTIFFGFLRQIDLWDPDSQINYQVFFQIQNPVNSAEILARELIGVQSEMVV